jgi:hypothetical protein
MVINQFATNELELLLLITSDLHTCQYHALLLLGTFLDNNVSRVGAFSMSRDVLCQDARRQRVLVGFFNSSWFCGNLYDGYNFFPDCQVQKGSLAFYFVLSCAELYPW